MKYLGSGDVRDILHGEMCKLQLSDDGGSKSDNNMSSWVIITQCIKLLHPTTSASEECGNDDITVMLQLLDDVIAAKEKTQTDFLFAG